MFSDHQYDIIVAGDFSFAGGTSTATAHELRVLAEMPLRTAVWHYDRNDARPARSWNPEIRAQIAAGAFPPLSAADKVRVHTLVLHNPMSLLHGVPRSGIRPDRILLVGHHPVRDRFGRFYYDPWRITRLCRREFGCPVYWAPVSPLCRQSLHDVGFAGEILARGWTNFVFPEDWPFDVERPASDRPVIGRHSNDLPKKWPGSRAEILTVYPADQRFRVRVLGAGPWLADKLGGWPENWEVHAFGSMPVEAFLAGIDFFVYFHREDWVEAFGRTILEAAASGAVCILPPHFEETFGDLALYCQPAEAPALVEALYHDRDRWETQRALALERVRARFGPDSGRARYELVASDEPLPMAPAPARPLKAGAFRARLWLTRQIRRAQGTPRKAIKPLLARWRGRTS